MSVSDKLLKAAVDKLAGNKLGNLASELNEFTKGLDPAEGKEARLLILSLVKNATEAFFEKMAERIENDNGAKQE